MDTLLPQGALGWLRHMIGSDAIRKTHPAVEADAQDNALVAALERLAATSPHLLADLGFEAVPPGADAARQVWRRGALQVSFEPGAALDEAAACLASGR